MVRRQFAQLPGCGFEASFRRRFPWKQRWFGRGAGVCKTGAGIGTALPKVGLRCNLLLQRVLGRGVRRIGGRSLLVLSELYYPGWTASVNGKTQRIWKVDGALRGIVVPQGDSQVSLHYRPVSLYIGAALSVIAFGTVVGQAIK